jgi:outer membrane protein assembly factor BamB
MRQCNSPGSRFALLASCIILTAATAADAADWPAWRHDANRSAATTQQLNESLNLQWSRHLPASEPAWPEDPRLQFDASYEPVVMGDTLFVGSASNDSITAYDTGTGNQKWRFFANGPVRFAPLCSDGRVYFGADDGIFYCLNGDTGKQVWAIKTAPANRKVVGNGRLISVWPMRGGPVLLDGQIHFTVGVWPFEGNFHCTVDIQSNDKNSTAQPKFTVEPLSGLTPQGYLTANDTQMFIPCGRSVAGCFNRETGKPVRISYSTRGTTNYHVSTVGPWLFHGTMCYHVPTGKVLQSMPHPPVLTKERFYVGGAGSISAFDLAKTKTVEVKDRRGKITRKTVLENVWKLADNAFKKRRVQVDLRAGDRLYGHAGTTVFAVHLPKGDTPARVSWTAEIEGTPSTMLAADDKLFVVTDNDRIYAFGDNDAKPKTHLLSHPEAVAGDKVWADKAAAILKTTGAKSGYCLALGIGSGQLIEEVLRQSDLRVIAIDPDEAKVSALRTRLDAAGLYGTRVVAQVGDPQSFGFPPYLAQLVVSEDIAAAGFNRGNGFVESVFHVLRPYGGTVGLELTAAEHQRLTDLVAAAKPAGAELKRSGGLSLLVRAGALPGAADWTHEYGDAANTLMARDQLVKPPLGVLWFGGPSADGSLFYNRHYWGPSLAVINGRMFIQGPGKMTAVDVYTGRILWQVPLKEQKKNRDGRRGWNFEKVLAGFHFVAAEDALYLVNGREIVRLDPETGKTLATFSHPDDDAIWGRLRVHEDLLIVTVFRTTKKYGRLPTELIALDKLTGKTRWTKKANLSFPVVALGGDKLFAFDGAMEEFYNIGIRRGAVPKAADDKFLKAIDLKTGKTVWTERTDIIATWLSFSKAHDVMVVSNQNQIATFRGKTGKELWRKYSVGKGFKGHPENYWDKVIVWQDRILDQRGPGQSYDLETGASNLRKNPLTGEDVPWSFTKSGHHCNYAIASPHMMTFRAASAGFCDITTGGTSHLKGFRSGCRNSLIPADGVLNAPNFAHGCSCGYSLFTSLALVHVPDSEMWSYSTLKLDAKKESIRRVGINLAAPGDRVDKDGTLWLEYPKKGGSSPAVAVTATGPNRKMFLRHSSQVKGDHPWVTASGIEGTEKVTVNLGKKPAKATKYTVRLYFLEPNETTAGKRVFNVALQGKPVLENLDVYKQSGGSNRGLVREFKGVEIDGTLSVTLKATVGLPVISGVEVVAEP